MDQIISNLFLSYDFSDIVDQIMTDMGNQNRTRRSVVKQMVYLGLVGSAAELKKRSEIRRSLPINMQFT